MGQKGVVGRSFDPEWMRFPADKESKLPSPVTTYKLSPEELAELDKLSKPTGKAPIKLPRRKRKEDETMTAIQMTEEEARGKLPPEVLDTIGQSPAESQENKGFEVFDKNEDPYRIEQKQSGYYEGGGKRFTAERITRAEQTLSKEEYIRLKNDGVTDHKIIATHEGLNSDVLVALKKKWGVNITLPKIPPHKQKEESATSPSSELPVKTEEPREGPSVQTTPAGLTIVQAIKLRQELAEDVVSLSRILDVADRGAELTGRIIRMLEGQRDIHQTALDRLNEAFERTVLPL